MRFPFVLVHTRVCPHPDELRPYRCGPTRDLGGPPRSQRLIRCPRRTGPAARDVARVGMRRAFVSRQNVRGACKRSRKGFASCSIPPRLGITRRRGRRAPCPNDRERHTRLSASREAGGPANHELLPNSTSRVRGLSRAPRKGLTFSDPPSLAWREAQCRPGMHRVSDCPFTPGSAPSKPIQPQRYRTSGTPASFL